MASDTPDQNISQYFSVCNDFIHAARLRDGNVLIHCLAGMSRSVTVTVAYIMSVTHLTWKESLKVVRTGRSVANPNWGFQMQLRDFELYKLAEVSGWADDHFSNGITPKLVNGDFVLAPLPLIIDFALYTFVARANRHRLDTGTILSYVSPNSLIWKFFYWQVSSLICYNFFFSNWV